VFRNLRHSEINGESFGHDFMRSYISEAKRYNPTLDQKVYDYIINNYMEKRRVFICVFRNLAVMKKNMFIRHTGRYWG